MSKTPSAPAKGITVTFSDRIRDLLTHYEVDGFHADYRTEADLARAPHGKAAMVAAFDAAQRSGKGWKMEVAPEALDYILAPTGFCLNTLDIFDCGGGDGDPRDTRAVRSFYARMKALRAAQ